MVADTKPASGAAASNSVQADARVHIALGARGYHIVIGRGLLSDPARWPALPLGKAAVIVTNTTVRPLHVAALEAALQRQGRRALVVELPDGETHKTWDSVDAIVTRMLEAALDRKAIVFALGGGVVGDVAGFAAACYMRGVPCVQVPTTLLAQVDSSVGGKTAINHALGKNMVGVFHQPSAVLCDLATLDTLPDREFRAGLAEVIKYGPIADLAFLDWLEANIDALVARDPAALRHAVRRSCEIKADIVARDEREADLRAILNFGHTFGHAIESQTGYAWLHGEAVAAGMVLALSLSARMHLVPQAFADRVRRLIVRAGLPVRAPSMPWAAWQAWMRVDKKADDGSIRYVLIDGPGSAVMRAVDDATVRAVVEAHTAEGAQTA
jgi:3-dehydroquinate synthase